MASWTCSYCGQPQPLLSPNTDQWRKELYIKESKFGRIGIAGTVIACANQSCGELTLTAALERHRQSSASVSEHTFITNLQTWSLLPDGRSKPWPDYIPESLREDYTEACQILSRSPKAAATLARRCVQGIIRDFCKIQERTLNAEIEKLRTAVSERKVPTVVTLETVDGIDHVRQVGNIGAHMNADVSVITAVEPEEADLLIELIEMLFREWYVGDYERRKRLEQLAAVAASKKQNIQQKPQEAS